MIGRFAASAIALGLGAVGLGAIVAPSASAGQYGLPVEEPYALGYVRALGVRDVVFGLLVARALARGERRATAAALGIGSLIAAGDFFVVLRARGAGPHLAVHAIGGAGMLAAWAVLRAEPDDTSPGPTSLPG